MDEITKLYYSIGEISEMTELKQYVLRYWETEFSQLRPSKNSAGNRTYKKKDLEFIKEIKNLLYNQKFTIKGAQQYLKDKKSNDTSKVEKSNNLSAKMLLDINSDINEIQKLIENFKDKFK